MARRPASPSLRRRPRARQLTLPEFFDSIAAPERTTRARAPIVPPGKGFVIALWDDSRTALAPWAAAGFECRYHSPSSWLDLANLAASYTHDSPVFACAFPDSTDLSIAGARWFKEKRKQDPQFQQKAANRFADVEQFFRQCACPYLIEGPAVGRLRQLWRRPEFTYHPCHYGGYLSTDDSHPLYPTIIPRRDAYQRGSGVWIGGGMRLPARRPVEPEWVYHYSVRKRERRRMNPIVFARGPDGRAARACPPRGFALAVCKRLTKGV